MASEPLMLLSSALGALANARVQKNLLQHQWALQQQQFAMNQARLANEAAKWQAMEEGRNNRAQIRSETQARLASPKLYAMVDNFERGRAQGLPGFDDTSAMDEALTAAGYPAHKWGPMGEYNPEAGVSAAGHVTNLPDVVGKLREAQTTNLQSQAANRDLMTPVRIAALKSHTTLTDTQAANVAAQVGWNQARSALAPQFFQSRIGSLDAATRLRLAQAGIDDQKLATMYAQDPIKTTMLLQQMHAGTNRPTMAQTFAEKQRHDQAMESLGLQGMGIRQGMLGVAQGHLDLSRQTAAAGPQISLRGPSGGTSADDMFDSIWGSQKAAQDTTGSGLLPPAPGQ